MNRPESDEQLSEASEATHLDESPTTAPQSEESAEGGTSMTSEAAGQVAPTDLDAPTSTEEKKSAKTRTEKPRRASDGRSPKGRNSNNKSPRPREERHSINRFVTISWSSQREPVDTMFWCEAERRGSWIEVTALEQVRTRREILERLTELDAGLVGLDFSFSYPAPFMEFLKEHAGVANWRALLKKVREELKKNVDDGVRVWIERIGNYREAHLEPNPAPIRTYERGRNGREMKERKPAPYEQGSLAERYRRTESALRRAAENAMQSSLQVSYNRLTSRYEFSGELQRGRNALLGMSMLDQLLEAREDAAVWPWKKPEKLTIVEIFPWMFRREKPPTPEACRRILAAEEDNGTEIPNAARDLICRNADAQRAFFSLMGMIRTEARIEKLIRPLRDYQPQFYSDPRIQQEGWFYGVGYKLNDDQKETRNPKSDSTSPHETSQLGSAVEPKAADVVTDQSPANELN